MRKVYAIAIAFALLATVAQAQDLANVNFHLRDINGHEQSFQDLLQSIRGSKDHPQKGVLMVSFWALWCNPCKAEMKAMVPVFEKLKDKNFHYLAINTDKPRSIAKVKAYVIAQHLPYHFWLDPNSEVFQKLNGQSMPYALLLNEKGELLRKSVGFISGDEKEIEKAIVKYLE